VGIEAALADEAPVMLVVIVPPPVCGTGVPPMLLGAVAPVTGVAVFAGEILVVMLPGLLGVGDGACAWASDEDCTMPNTVPMTIKMLITICVVRYFQPFFMGFLSLFKIDDSYP
jgi:hypothetical protein